MYGIVTTLMLKRGGFLSYPEHLLMLTRIIEVTNSVAKLS